MTYCLHPFHCTCTVEKWPGEAKGLCCSGVKVLLSRLGDPTEPLKGLLTGDTVEARAFRRRQNISYYSSAFQMTSFGADKDLNDHGFFATVRIQGQVHHRMGSLLSLPGEQPQFAQVFFCGTREEQAVQCQKNSPGGLQLEISAFKRCCICTTTMSRTSSMLRRLWKSKKTVKWSSGQTQCQLESMKGEWRYNAPTADEVAIIITGYTTLPG